MISFGIDPGTARCGFGLIEVEGDRLTALEFGSIETSPKARMQDRLEKIYDNVDALMKKYRPDVMGVEKLFFGRNATTAIPVGQARGVVMLAAAKNAIELIELTPAEITQVPDTTVTLAGKDAEKMQNLLDALDEDDDVQNVYGNYEFAD